MTDKTNVTSLQERRIKPNENTIETLERWLAWAKSGEIQAVAIVGIVTGGTNRHVVAGHYDYPEMNFGLDMLKRHVLDSAAGPHNMTLHDDDSP